MQQGDVWYAMCVMWCAMCDVMCGVVYSGLRVVFGVLCGDMWCAVCGVVCNVWCM